MADLGKKGSASNRHLRTLVVHSSTPYDCWSGKGRQSHLHGGQGPLRPEDVEQSVKLVPWAQLGRDEKLEARSLVARLGSLVNL
jgi:hypothetical protein